MDARGTLLANLTYQVVKDEVADTFYSFVFSAVAQNNGHALGNCQIFDAGGFSTKECGDDTHDYAFISPAPEQDSPELLTIACSTECPYANGQQYTASKGEV